MLKQDADVETSVGLVCGSAFTDRFLGAARAASLRRVTTPAAPSPPSAGGAEAPTTRKRRAGAYFHPHPIKDANALDVRRQALLLLEILARLRPWKERHPRRTGHEMQGHELNKNKLAKRVGVCTKEIERYLNVLEDGGILRRWQPPKRSGAPRGYISGHCFSLYELIGEVPAQLRLELERWHGRAQKLERAELAALAVDVERIAPSSAPPITGVYDSASALEAVRKLRGPP